MPANDDSFEVKPYSTKELCLIYGVGYKTFSRWLKPFMEEIGAKSGRFYNVRQIEVIIGRLGMPYVVRA
ncbi:MAG: hypothetical protein ABIY51_00240 [Ferruginibacter sp.]